MALEEVDLLIEGEDDVLHGLAIHLEITGKVRDHEVIGIEPTLYHPLAPEDVLLHGFKPGLQGSLPLLSLNIPDVEHPLTHLDGLRVSQHLREVSVDDLLEKLVLGSTWGRHDDLDLSEK